MAFRSAHPPAPSPLRYAPAPLTQRDHALLSLFRGLESALWVFLILFFSGAIIGLTFASAEALEQGDSPVTRLLWFPVYAMVAGFVLMRLPGILRLAARNPLIVLCVLWMGLTFFWSIDPGVTIRRSISLLMTTMAGLALAARYDWDEMVERIGWAVILMCGITLVVAIATPYRGIMQEIHPGAWRGPWAEKNYLGGIMAKGFAVCLCLLVFRPRKRLFWGGAAAVALLVMLLSTSKTSLLAAMACLGLFCIVFIYRRFPVLRVLLLWAVVAGACATTLLLTVGFEWALSLIGKDPTLTGRTDIWVLLGRAIELKPWFGYGYGTFWLDEFGPSYETRTVLEWAVPTAHNGWLDSWLSGGAVVIGMFSVLLVATVVRAVVHVHRGGEESYWVLLSTVFFLIFSLSESAILQQNDISWVMFTATTAKLWANDPPWRPIVRRRA